jgi:[ribosomal protein S5]-alanine N-acetyltransferase
MNLETERLRLRPIELSDLDSIHQLHLLPEVDQYNTMGIPESKNETETIMLEWIAATKSLPPLKYVFLLHTREGHFVGIAGMNMEKSRYKHSELWYKFHPTYWNKGYATEVVKAFVAFCFNKLKLHRITAGCAIQNKASIKVLEKCGFTREAHHRKILPIRGEWVDNVEYAILEEDFYKQP